MTTRFYAFSNVFRGYQFYDKETGGALPKWQVFVTYFQGWYPNEGQSVDFLSEAKRSRFDQIVQEYQGRLVPVNRHPYYAIRDTPGWDRGVIRDPESYFERPHPSQDILLRRSLFLRKG